MLAQDWHGDNHIVKIVLHGFHGAVTVKGEQFNNVMAPWGKVLKDEQIAAVLTYVRNEWGNKAPPITKEFVSKVREQTKDRTEPWTPKELQAIERLLVQDAAAAPAAAAAAAPGAANAGAPAGAWAPPAAAAQPTPTSNTPAADSQSARSGWDNAVRRTSCARRACLARRRRLRGLSMNVKDRQPFEEVGPLAAR